MGRILIDGAPYHIEHFDRYIGRVIGMSDWLTVDQKRIDEFGHATNDMNRLHVDPEFARTNGPFGGIVAHGFLTLALLTHLSQTAEMMPEGVDYGINVGFERVRFLAPVPVDSAIRLKATVLACEPRQPGRWTFKSRCNIEVRDSGRVALSAIWTVLFINAALSGMNAADMAAERR